MKLQKQKQEKQFFSRNSLNVTDAAWLAMESKICRRCQQFDIQLLAGAGHSSSVSDTRQGAGMGCDLCGLLMRHVDDALKRAESLNAPGVILWIHLSMRDPSHRRRRTAGINRLFVCVAPRVWPSLSNWPILANSTHGRELCVAADPGRFSVLPSRIRTRWLMYPKTALPQRTTTS